VSTGVPGDRTLITREGDKFTGGIAREGDVYRIETLTGEQRIPAGRVVCIFSDLREAVRRTQTNFAEAKKLYEEALPMPEENPDRSYKLHYAIDIALHAAELCRGVEPYLDFEDQPPMERNAQAMMQFVRLCREAAYSERTGSASRPRPVELHAPEFEHPPLPSWAIRGDLGPGLEARARDLSHPDPAVRSAAIRSLTRPPSPAHLTALLQRLGEEPDTSVRQALTEGMSRFSPAALLKAAEGVRNEKDPALRAAVFDLLGFMEDPGAADLVLRCFLGSLPKDDAERAMYATAFRRLRLHAIPRLNELLSRPQEPAVRTELVRQLGAVGDATSAPALVRAIPACPHDAAAALLKLGRPALPAVLEGASSIDTRIREACTRLSASLETAAAPAGGDRVMPEEFQSYESPPGEAGR
jgi:hypothetical protein